jgi:hypothetical protein
MSKNVKCGKIGVWLEKEKNLDGIKFANVFDGLYFIKLWHKYCF